MAVLQPNQFRNLAFVGHSGAGKTSLAEAILFKTGMTNRLDTLLPDLVDAESAITLNRTRFLLVEPPFNRAPAYIEDVIGRLLTQRLVPVLAHPERNIEFQRRPKRLQGLVDEGVVVQIAAGSLTGQNGPGARRAAEQFIRRGIAHVVASEMHAVGPPRPPGLSDAFDIVAELIDEQDAIDLFETNPNMILEGHSPQREPTVSPRVPRVWVRIPSLKISNPVSDRMRRRWRRRIRRIRRRTNRA